MQKGQDEVYVIYATIWAGREVWGIIGEAVRWDVHFRRCWFVFLAAAYSGFGGDGTGGVPLRICASTPGRL